MKKIILMMVLLFSASMADSVLLVKKGWQLIGSSTALDSMSKFGIDNVEQVWHFDASAQKWLGYSPDATVQKKMSDNNVAKLEKLKNWHGFWIKSKEDWTLTFEDKKLSSEPSQTENGDVIELKEGWNLISLPVDTVVSADIFEGMTAWKYNAQNDWEMFDEAQPTEEFLRLGHIKNSDGIWVKADVDKNISVIEEASKLHNFATVEEMKAYITEMATIYRRPYCGIEPFFVGGQFVSPSTEEGALTADTSNSAEVKDASGTNLQESDVDESDIVKHNGTHIFYVGKKDGRREHINVSSFEQLVNEESPLLDTISFSDERHIDSFYLVNNKLVVLSTLYPTYNNSSVITPERVLVDMYDVSDITNIKKLSSYKVDGYLKNSRVIGENLYLISSFSPKYSITYPKEYVTPPTVCQEYLSGVAPYNENDYDKYADCYNLIAEDGRYFRYNYDEPLVTMTDLLPEIEGSGISSQSLVRPQRLYASAKQNQASTMTTISNFSLATGNYVKNSSFVGESSVEYASSKSLYLVSNGYPHFYDFNNYKQRSMLYKFNFDEDVSYKAVGSVYGTALNQFSLSEHNEILRIATTEGFSWGGSGTKNTLYTLKEQDGLLPIQGLLSGLGKEGETIKSVRFVGTKAYLVTFRTTDPLYTIDLSNPKEPKKMGELEVNGYSAYLHPIGEDKLLGIGQDTDSQGVRKGVKIELFDISDFEHPSSLDSIVLGDNTYSELENNHKALAYRASDNLFAFPYSAYGSSNYLGIYQVENNTLKSYEELQSTSSDWGEHRGLIFDLNGKTYISFFADDTVLTKILTQKDN